MQSALHHKGCFITIGYWFFSAYLSKIKKSFSDHWPTTNWSWAYSLSSVMSLPDKHSGSAVRTILKLSAGLKAQKITPDSVPNAKSFLVVRTTLLMFLSVIFTSLTFSKIKLSLEYGPILKTLIWPPDYPATITSALSPRLKLLIELAVSF